MQNSKNQKINSSESCQAVVSFATRGRNYAIPTPPPEGIAAVIGYQIQTQSPEKVSHLKTIRKIREMWNFFLRLGFNLCTLELRH
jgi:hypothetical protein